MMCEFAREFVQAKLLSIDELCVFGNKLMFCDTMVIL